MFRLLSWIIVLCALFVAINYRWTHAFVVYHLAAEECDARAMLVAERRVEGLFGAVTSQPRIGCLWQPSLGLGHNIGTTNFAPGLAPVILLNSDGNRVDVIAHEWAHAELAERLGFFDRNFVLPTWVDEGVAMQVDRRDSYNAHALSQLNKREDLERPHHGALVGTGFFQAGDQGRYHYAWAKCAVAQWLDEETDWEMLALSDWSRRDTVCLGDGAGGEPRR